MTTTELKRLNNYPEIKTDAGINSIIQYINLNILPVGMNPQETARWTEKYGINSGFITRNINANQELFYNPLHTTVDLEVVRPADRQAAIQSIFDDVTRGMGVGLSAFYHQICMSFLGINKATTDEFLRRQGDYQVQRLPINKVINSPVVPATCNSIWGCDLIDMTNFPGILNQNRQYIFVAVDYWSGMVFARGITNRENNDKTPTLTNALNDIIHNDAGGTYCTSMVLDSEFAVGNFANFLTRHDIQIRKTSSYNPQANKTERYNRELRKKIKAYTIRTNSLVWNPHLADLVLNMNQQQQSTTHKTALDLWTPGVQKVHKSTMSLPHRPLNDAYSQGELNAYVNRYHTNRAADLVAITHSNDHTYQVGDYCRIKLLKLSNVMRRHRESHIGYNRVALHYSPLRVVIHSVIPATNIRRVAYTLSHNGYVIQQGPVPRLFYSSDLVPSPDPAVQTHVQPETVARALVINRLPAR